MQIRQEAGGVFFYVFAAALIVLGASGRDARAETARRVESTASASLSARADAMKRDASLAFERNIGQTDPQVKFLARAGDYTLFLTPTGPTLALRRAGSSVALRISLVGASAYPTLLGTDALAGEVNYFGGVRSQRAIGHVPRYAGVAYLQVYPGIDWIHYSNDHRLEHDFVVAPNVDASVIKLAFEGADGLEVDALGDLVVQTAAGELRQPRPVIYQEVNGVRRIVSGGYRIDGPQLVGFVVGAYDHARPLIIDPTIVYSTYLGGSSGDGASDIALDSAGNIYVAGTTASMDFPRTPGRGRTRSGDTDAFVAKFDAKGRLVYSTYLGGPCGDGASAVAVDSGGNAYVTGRANDGCMSLTDPAAGAFVAKLDPSGRSVYFFTFGGQWADLSTGRDIALQEIATREGTRVYAYVTGDTNVADFPTTPGAFQRNYGGYLRDAFVAKINPEGNALVYSTLLGGDGDESGSSIAVDATGSAYVVGGTTSKNFPTRNALEPVSRTGPIEPTAFVAKLLPDGSNLVYSTHLGGTMASVAHAIALDAIGNAYIIGSTTATDFPTTAGVVQPDFGFSLCLLHNCSHAFITKLDASASTRIYSTFLYGYSDTEGVGIAVDASGNAYVTGTLVSLSFPLVGAFQSEQRGVNDNFVAKLNADASRLLYSSYLGGNRMGSELALADNEATGSIAIDRLGNAYVTGYTNSPDFPTTPNAFQAKYPGGTCGVVPWLGPCSVGFITKIGSEGPGVVPAISLASIPDEVFAGGIMSATWAGIPTPGPHDELRLYPLGSGSDNFDHVAAWMTTGTAQGMLNLQLPATLKVGWYELRLLSPAPESTLLHVIARSEPVRVLSP